MKADNPGSKLNLIFVPAFACLLLGAQELLAWAELTEPNPGWLVRLTSADWLEPSAGLLLILAGGLFSAPGFFQCFSLRDVKRRRARQGAILAGIIAAISAVCSVETFFPAKSVADGAKTARLSKSSKQLGLLGLAGTVVGMVGFVWFRRRDVGFRGVSIMLGRENEIWRLSIKAEVAFRALPENEELYQFIERRAEFVQAAVGTKFDRLCQQLIKESADLATIDSTARLQMDVGHVFRRYADFHRRLTETRNQVVEEIMEDTREAVNEMIESQLPGQEFNGGTNKLINITISYPVLQDNESLKRRRAEWDETMRGIVKVGAETGNHIIGEWIDRAARGDISPDEMPVAVQLIRALSGGNNSAALPGLKQAGSLPALDFSPTANELHHWLGTDANTDDPNVAKRVRQFFAEKKLLLADCSTPELSAEQLMDFIRSEFGGLLTLRSIASALSARRG